eukprot:scaffold11488_cov109-Isochrysis_galbana.AAC.8
MMWNRIQFAHVRVCEGLLPSLHSIVLRASAAWHTATSVVKLIPATRAVSSTAQSTRSRCCIDFGRIRRARAAARRATARDGRQAQAQEGAPQGLLEPTYALAPAPTQWRPAAAQLASSHVHTAHTHSNPCAHTCT